MAIDEDARDDEDATGGDHPSQVGRHVDQRRRQDVGEHDVELSRDLGQGRRAGVDDVGDAVRSGVRLGGLDRRGRDVDPDDGTGSPLGSGNGEHTAPAPDVEHRGGNRAGRELPEECAQRQLRRRMVTHAEGGARIDENRRHAARLDGSGQPRRDDHDTRSCCDRRRVLTPTVGDGLVELDRAPRPRDVQGGDGRVDRFRRVADLGPQLDVSVEVARALLDRGDAEPEQPVRCQLGVGGGHDDHERLHQSMRRRSRRKRPARCT